MSDPKPEKKPSEPQSHGWMAEYDCEHKLMEACRKVRDSGYTKTDAFLPFPVHGIDQALGIKPTVLPWFSLCAGALGTCTALTMQYFFNAVDYPYIISGKPFASWPAFIPVTFELTVLFAAFTTVFAMLGLNGLPKWSNPVFTNPRFDRATDDRFFLWIDAADKYFNSEKVRDLLAETGAIEVDEVKDDDSSDIVPRALIITILTGIAASLIPLMVVLNMRNSKSGGSRLHVFFDMDYQPKRKTQTPTEIFANNRVQQPPVPGTVAHGELDNADPYYLGYDPDAAVAANVVESTTRLVSLQEGEEPAAAVDAEPQRKWLEEFPEGVVNDEMFELGKAKFEQNCAVCHGFSGYGDGLVAQRATNLAQGYWLPPTSLHDSKVAAQPVGQLYYTVVNGKGKMGGYGPSLNFEERWAVVLYVKALQRSQNAAEADVPEGVSVEVVAPPADAAPAKPEAPAPEAPAPEAPKLVEPEAPAPEAEAAKPEAEETAPETEATKPEAKDPEAATPEVPAKESGDGAAKESATEPDGGKSDS